MNGILDLESIENDFGMKLRRWNDMNFSWPGYSIGVENLTLADWDRNTPQVENLLSNTLGCKIRVER